MLSPWLCALTGMMYVSAVAEAGTFSVSVTCACGPGVIWV